MNGVSLRGARGGLGGRDCGFLRLPEETSVSPDASVTSAARAVLSYVNVRISIEQRSHDDRPHRHLATQSAASA